MKKTELKQQAWVAYVVIALFAVTRAFLNEIFIYPNNFAPSGVSGIATMVQYLCDFKVGYFNLLLNIPLLLFAAKCLSPKYTYRTLTYIVFFSAANILFRSMDFTNIAFIAKDNGDGIMAAVAAGVIGGLEYSTCVRLGGSTGGTDIISAYISKKSPRYNMVWVNFAINVTVALASFFVYGRKYSSVILCIIYVYVNTRIGDTIFKGAKNAIKFEVFTNQPDEMAEELMQSLRHGCTVLRGMGMYSHSERDLLICVINKHQVADFEKIIRKYPGSFAVISSVSSTYGNFKKIK